MGGRYLVTMIPGHMEMCSTYMAMFLGYHPLIGCVCVWSLASVEADLDPKWDTKAFWILAVYVSDVFETSWLGAPILE